MGPLRAWSLALGAGALAASADVAAHAVRATGAPHVAASLAGAALFFAAGRWTRPIAMPSWRAWLGPVMAGTALHAALDAAWLARAAHPIGLRAGAVGAAVALAAAFDAAVDLLSALAGARSRG